MASRPIKQHTEQLQQLKEDVGHVCCIMLCVTYSVVQQLKVFRVG